MLKNHVPAPVLVSAGRAVRPRRAASRRAAAVRALAYAALLAGCGNDTRPGERAPQQVAGAGAQPSNTAGHGGASENAAGGMAPSAGASPALGGVPNTAGISGADAGATSTASLLPARIRRLASAEYDASVQALLGTRKSPASGPDFPPDLRQDGFTVNDAQRIDAVIVERLDDAALALATEAQQNGTLARLAPCAPSDDATGCAERFITTFGAKIYRRTLVDAEVRALLALYAAAAEDATYLDGVAHVTRGLLESAGFLYLTELGDSQPGTSAAVELTPSELASALSYYLTSAPPDDELLAKAQAGALADPDVREAEARRLFATAPAAKDTVVRLVREWLGIDGIDASAKDTLVYPDFAAEKPKIVAESSDFVRAVAFESTGTVSELLGANWTVDSGPLGMYRAQASGPIAGTSLIERVGILNQAAFLATYANAHESHPVFRGVAVARRVACIPLDSPASFNLQVVPPAPDATKTTRERFAEHVVDPICAGCHDIIDPFGFSFEHYDGMGGYRAQENGQDVDSAVAVSMEADYDGAYADSNALATVFAQSDSVRECFARLMYRAAAATGDEAATPGEAEFVQFWRALPAAAQGNIVETLLAYVKSPNFVRRQAL